MHRTFLIVVAVAVAFSLIMCLVHARMGRWPWQSDTQAPAPTRGGTRTGGRPQDPK